MPNFLDLNAFIEHKGKKDPIFITISQPAKNKDSEDYYCCVHMPQILKGEKKIFGIDSSQALELSIQFIKTILAGKKIVDADGNEIEFDLAF